MTAGPAAKWCAMIYPSAPTAAGAVPFHTLSQALAFTAPAMNPCNCIGPQRGEPRCPCGMRGVIRRDGRWIQAEVDLGPAPPPEKL